MNGFNEYFYYNDNQLKCEDLSLKDLAVEYGTPLYVYSERGFTDRLSEFRDALNGIEHLICYSVKSNSNVHILRLMAEAGTGMDVVSGGEVYRALKAGVEGSKIVFAGVGKTSAEIEYAMESKILMFNSESFQEIEAINSIALRKGITSNIAIRINPDVEANTHHYITTGKKENKFGISIESLMDHLGIIRNYKGVNFRGLHCHIGSQIEKPEPFITALERLFQVISELKKSGFSGIEYINLGGGFGIRYGEEHSFPVKEWAESIKGLIKPLNLKLIIEPGRYISGNNGALLIKVLYTKTSHTKNFLITDGGMNDLIRPTLYGAYQEIINCTEREGVLKADIVGPICESGDVFAKDRNITMTEPGDVLAVMSAGAYAMSMASRYNSRLIPAEVLIGKDGKARLIRKRDSYEDLVSKELV